MAASGGARSRDLGDVAAIAVEAAIDAGADAAEGYASRSTGRQITVYDGEVESLQAAGGRGVGVRALLGGAQGYAYCSGDAPDDVRAAAIQAVDNARVTEPDPYAGLPAPARAEPIAGLWSDGIASVSVGAKILLAKDIERAARAADARITTIEQTVYAESEGEVGLVSSAGARGEYRSSSCYAYLYAFAEADGDLTTGLAVTVGRGPADLDEEGCGREGAARAVRGLGGRPCPSFRGPVVFDPFVTASIVGAIGGMLSAEAVQRGRSPFADRLGAEIAAPGLALADDGRHPDGLASRPFDGEGVPTRRTPLIEAGTLRGYLHDTVTASRAGRAEGSTGNAVRGGYASGPSVGPTNLVLAAAPEATVTGLGALLAGLADGLYVTEVVGLNAGVDPVSGDFSVGATGLRIRGGALAEPVKEVTVAGNLVEMLRRLSRVADDARWVPFGGSVLAPTALVDEMTVSGPASA